MGGAGCGDGGVCPGAAKWLRMVSTRGLVATLIALWGFWWLAPVCGEERVHVEVSRPNEELGERASPSGPTAQALPREVTICRGKQRCWSEAGRTRCSPQEGELAIPFGVFPVDETDSLAQALRRCWESQPSH